MAVGAYGRNELCPASDLDVAARAPGRGRDVEDIARQVWYPIWDAGLELDHSVRTVGEALDAADRDLKTVLGLLDARFVAGDAELGADLVRRARRAVGEAGVAVAADPRRRRSTIGTTASARPRSCSSRSSRSVEGGCRDAASARGARRRRAGHRSRRAPDRGRARRRCSAARVELHRVAGRALDRLLLQYQDAVAENLAGTSVPTPTS